MDKWGQLFERTWSEIVWEVTGETIVAASTADRTSQQHFKEKERRKGPNTSSEVT